MRPTLVHLDVDDPRDTIIVCNRMQCNICNLRMDICRKLVTDSMNVVLCLDYCIHCYQQDLSIGSRECENV